MSQKATTADERFLIRLYQTAQSSGDLLSKLQYLGIARSMGLKENALKNMIKHLAQANLICKLDEASIRLTSRGCDLVSELLDL